MTVSRVGVNNKLVKLIRFSLTMLRYELMVVTILTVKPYLTVC